jgi:hypothetical protein
LCRTDWSSQLAALCASLDVSGHGITGRPARQPPGPWLSMLARYHRRQPDRALGRDTADRRGGRCGAGGDDRRLHGRGVPRPRPVNPGRVITTQP